MKKIFFLLIAVSIPALLIAQTTLKLTTGSSIHVGAAGVLTLDNMNLEIDGSISTAPGSSMIRLTGNTTTSILGTSPAPPMFDVLQIEKTGGALVRLQRNINVRTSINLTSGLFDLNGNVIFLTTNAVLIGESPTSHITGTSGYIEGSQLLNAPVSQNPGNLGATISSSQNLGLVIVRRGHQSQTNGAGSGNSILRYYDIFPANNTALNATLRFNYLDAELNGLPENSLVLWKSDNGVSWSNEGFSSRDMAVNYVEKTGLSDFSRWTLSSPGNALPLVWGAFNIKCLDASVVISWETMQEQNTASFMIQGRNNGPNWTDIATLNAAGQSNAVLKYSHTIQQSTWNYYRIMQTDIDGHITYSPVMMSRCGENDFFNVYPNPVPQYTVNVALSGNNAKTAWLRLYDSKGSLLNEQRKNLQPGMNQVILNLPAIPQGIYTLVATWDDGRTKAVKLVKQ